MNKLKKLFSPTALAATLSTGMLLHSALNVYAGTISTCSASATWPTACNCAGVVKSLQCPFESGDVYYYCCPVGYNCEDAHFSSCSNTCQLSCGGNAGIYVFFSN